MNLETRLAAAMAAIGDAVRSLRLGKADDTTVVHRTGNETVSGTKTFGSPPVVPPPSAAAHPVRHDDGRLANSRTPTTHASSHVAGGPDPLTPAQIGAVGAAGNETVQGVKRFAENTFFSSHVYIASSAPQADGVLRRDTIEALIAAGRPPTVLCQARAIAEQPISGGWNQVTLGGEDFDDDNVHSTGSNSGRFVMARSGIYRISAGVAWKTGQSTANTARQCRLVVNGAGVLPGVITGYYGFNGFNLLIAPLLVRINAGQYVELQAASSLSGAVLAGGGNNDYASWMTTELVRAL